MILCLLVLIGLPSGLCRKERQLAIRETGSYIRFIVGTDILPLINVIFSNIISAGQYDELVTDYSIINRFKENQIAFNVYGSQFTAERPDNDLTRLELLGQNNNNYHIPDFGYVSSSFNMTSAPSGATITGITYNVRIAHNWVGDLRVAISNNVPRELVIWNRLGGDTDGGNDSDPANDDDIELTWIWVNAL